HPRLEGRDLAALAQEREGGHEALAVRVLHDPRAVVADLVALDERLDLALLQREIALDAVALGYREREDGEDDAEVGQVTAEAPPGATPDADRGRRDRLPPRAHALQHR